MQQGFPFEFPLCFILNHTQPEDALRFCLYQQKPSVEIPYRRYRNFGIIWQGSERIKDIASFL